jgi:hypothetical protein
MSIDGRLLEPIEAPSSDGTHLLRMEKNTRTVDDKGDVVTLITVREVAQVPELPNNAMIVDKAYEFTPSGIAFDTSVRLTLGYDVNKLPKQIASIFLAYYTPKSGWVELKSENGAVASIGRLTAPVEHFTIFAVLAKPTNATFRVTKLNITPSLERAWGRLTFALRTGREVNISALVTNYGGKPGDYDAILRINGQAVDERQLTIGPTESQMVTFTRSGNKPGRYEVQIGDLSGEFVSGEFVTSLWINWWLILIVILVLALIGWLVRKYLVR